MIELHYVHTPNVRKVAIMLEEVGLPSRRIYYDIRAGDHLSPSLRALNPNNKLPVIRDLDPAGGGDPVTVFESGAILIYLAEKTGRFLVGDERGRTLTLQWLMWQMAGLGPMAGQAAHFQIYAPERLDYPIERYNREVARLLNVLEHRLRESEYLAGDYSIADIACWPVIAAVNRLIDMSGFPDIQRWHDAIAERAAVKAALSISDIPPRLLENPAELTPEEWSNLHGQNLLAASAQG